MGLSVQFWGVRGSVASPGPNTMRIGGNTSCVEVIANKTELILDAGTGLRGLGEQILRQKERNLFLLLSHLHFDHIQGIPFFGPLYHPETHLHMISGPYGAPLKEVIRRHMSAPTFPVDLNAVPSSLSFQELAEFKQVRLGEADVTICRANHPDAAYAYRIEHEGQVIVFATDTEHGDHIDAALLELAYQADILIYDAQYLPEEYRGEVGMSRKGWGHSTFEAAAELADAARVKQLVLFHHDPTRDDAGVEVLEARARQHFPNVIAAREGMRLCAR